MKKKFLAILLIVSMTALCGCQNAKLNKEDITPYSEILTVTAVYPHNEDYFTEGLFCRDGSLYESTGRKGRSCIVKYAGEIGEEPENKMNLSNEYFGEGSVYFNGNIYILTYTQNEVLLYDVQTLTQKTAYAYPREGWGLTTDGEYLIAGDGSSSVYYLDSELNLVKSLNVTYKGKKVENINELEYINGYIWANVWLEEYIIVIDPHTGNVEKVISFSDIVPEKEALRSSDSVLNGIAYNEQTGKVYVTGKNWPVLYELEFN